MISEILTSETMLYAGAFLFVFGAVYGVLTILNIFPRAASGVIALGIAFFAIAYSPLIVTAMPLLSIVFIIFFFVYFIKVVFEREEKTDFVPVLVALGALLLGLPLAGITFENLTVTMQQNIVYFIALVIILIMFYAAYRIKEE